MRLLLTAFAVLVLCAPAAARQSDIAPDGTVLITGNFARQPFGGSPIPHLCEPFVTGLLRTTFDGTRVHGFGHSGFVAGDWTHVVALRDGSIAAVGRRSPTAVSHVDADGRELSLAHVNTGFDIVEDARQLPDGRVLISGLVRADNDAYRLGLAVVRVDGTLDPAFGQNGIVLSQGALPANVGGRPNLSPLGCFPIGDRGGAPAWVLPDGRILAGGPALVARFTAAGQPDSTWGGDGEVSVDEGPGIVAPEGDAVFVLGFSDKEHVRIRRLQADGTPDPAWGAGGEVTISIGRSVSDIKDARAFGDGRLAFLVDGQPYVVAADGTFTSGPAGGATYTDLFLLGAQPTTIGPEGEHFTLKRYAPDLATRTAATLDIVGTAPRVLAIRGPQKGAVTGTKSVIHIDLEERAVDEGQAGVLCGSGLIPTECARDLTLPAGPEGPRTLTFYPRSIHGAAGPPQTFTWVMNFAAPETTIDARPARESPRRTARFAWTTSEIGTTTTCAIDGRVRRCTSPVRLSGLHPGRHRFEAIATDEWGAREPKPATVVWRVGPVLKLRARGRTVVLATVAAPIRGRATIHRTLLRGRRVVRRLPARTLTLRAERSRTLRFTVPRGLRLRVSARMPGTSRPVVRTLGARN